MSTQRLSTKNYLADKKGPFDHLKTASLLLTGVKVLVINGLDMVLKPSVQVLDELLNKLEEIDEKLNAFPPLDMTQFEELREERLELLKEYKSLTGKEYDGLSNGTDIALPLERMKELASSRAFRNTLAVGFAKNVSITSSIRFLEKLCLDKFPVEQAGKLCKGENACAHRPSAMSLIRVPVVQTIRSRRSAKRRVLGTGTPRSGC